MSIIVTYPDPILRKKSEPIEFVDDELAEFVEKMQDIMYEKDGVGLAAPQIGVSKRIIVLDDGNGLIGLINPVITEMNDNKEPMEEGCLSLPDVRVMVNRPTSIQVEGLDIHGNPVQYTADDMLARIFQHEIDHLNGILIIDYLSTIQRSLMSSKLKQLQRNADS